MTINEAIAEFRNDPSISPIVAPIDARLDEFIASIVEQGGTVWSEVALEFVRECRGLLIESVPKDDFATSRKMAQAIDFAGWKLQKLLSKVNGSSVPAFTGPVPRRPKPMEIPTDE